MITLKHVSKSFDEKETFSVQDISLSVLDGETLVLLGSSGSGKSTLLNLINSTLKPTSGTIEIEGKSIQQYPKIALRRSMGFVFQHTGLFPHMNVAKNIDIVMRLTKLPKSQRLNRVNELLEMVNLEPEKYFSRYPDELSGGEQQRVGVARALATNPKYILMDEPFAALDAITRDALQQEILDLTKRLNKTIIFVTHDINEAFRLADRIAVLHEGHLQQIGNKEELQMHPSTDFVRQLLTNKQH